MKQAQFDPSDVFFQGYLAVRASENLEKTADFREALDKLEQANQMFGNIQKFYPEWKPDMVNNRVGKTIEALKRLRKTEGIPEKEDGVVGDLEGAAPVPVNRPANSVVPTPPIQKSILEDDPSAIAHLREAEGERSRLKTQVSANESKPPAILAVRTEPPAAPSDHAAWTSYASVMEGLAETGGSGYTYVLHKDGGTSVYLKVVYDNKTIGAILPENSATSIQGEITSWSVARMLGVPNLSQPAVSINLKGHALKTFRDQLASSSFKGHKEKNRTAVLSRIDKNATGIPTVFKQWLPMRPVGLDSLVSRGRLRKDTRLAGFLRNTEPMPGKDAMSFKEIRDAETPETELACQMSNILLVDALVGQWDRFSGGNIHAYAADGRLRLAALDNGGATVTSGNGYLTQFEESVTRFDKRSVDKLLAMRAFLIGESTSFADHENPVAFTESLGFSERNHERFVARVKRVADHVEACVKREGGLFQ